MRSYRVWGLILIVGTVAIAFFELDKQTISYFYQDCQCWDLAEKGFWRFLYLYAPVPGYLLAMVSLVAISLSYSKPAWLSWRKPAMMMVFCLAVGPGILVNLVFKDNWGRPRPREVLEFGGREAFLQPWQPGKRGEGKSFPCGHCSIAFYLAVPFLFLKRRHAYAAWAFLIAGLVLGSLTGLARMMAGGHFLSDVLWSWGLVWFSALLGLAIFRPEKPVSEELNPKTARWVAWVTGVLLPVLTVLMAVATPYVSSKSHSKTADELIGINVVLIDCFKGNVEVKKGETFELSYQVYGFGFPGSKAGLSWRQANDTLFVVFDKTGFFTEFKNEVKISIPKQSTTSFALNLARGQINELSEFSNFRSYFKKR